MLRNNSCNLVNYARAEITECEVIPTTYTLSMITPISSNILVVITIIVNFVAWVALMLLYCSDRRKIYVYKTLIRTTCIHILLVFLVSIVEIKIIQSSLYKHKNIELDVISKTVYFVFRVIKSRRFTCLIATLHIKL